MNDSLTRILTSVRCFLWEATVKECPLSSGGSPLSWETTFLHDDALEHWLPIPRTPGHAYACDFYGAVLTEDRIQADATAARAILEGKGRYQQDYRLRLTDGRYLWLHEDVQIQPTGSGSWKLTAIGTDITEKKTAETAQAQALENAHCILWYAWIEQRTTVSDWDEALALDQNLPAPDYSFHWDISLLNEAAARMWLPVAPTSDGKYTTALHRATVFEDRMAGDALSTRCLREGRSTYTQYRRVETRHGEIRCMREEVALKVLGEGIWYAAGVMVDVTAQKNAEDILNYQATHDSLTGLYNRSHFLTALSSQTEQLPDLSLQPSCLFFLDVDNFKPINDRFGHLVGDLVLTQLAKRLEQEIGNRGTVARIGGDEFTIFLPEIWSENETVRLAEALIQTISRPIVIEQQSFTLSVSVGIAQGQGHDPQELLGKANTAMLQAKRKGKAHYQFFTPEMEESNLLRFEQETKLRRAVQLEAFVPYYQPIVSLATGQVVGMEALARWPLQDGSFCPPSEFIPLAEQTGLIVPLSKSLLRMICLDGRRIKNRFPEMPLRINYNVSERLFQEPGAFLQFRKLLQETRFPASALTLELTENLLLEDSENTRLCLQALDDLGIKLVLDDFGTGYSSLSYLTRLPVSAIKIDQSFVRALSSPNTRIMRQNQAIIRAIAALGKALDLEITAEGIESEKQLYYLRELGVQYGQGYLFAPPMPADTVEGYIRQQTQGSPRLAA